MQPETTRQDYIRRINKVMEYINNHLDETIDLKTIARISNFSEYHFHRIFRAFRNEPLAIYIIHLILKNKLYICFSKKINSRQLRSKMPAVATATVFMNKLYEILAENHSDYDLGFEVQSPQKAFISWDTTYQELIHSPLVEECNPLDMDFATYDEYRFKYPVRVGNLLLKELGVRFSFRQRDDIAVQSYFFRIYNPYTIDLKEIAAIKSTLARHLKERKGVSYYEIGFDFDTENNIVFLLYYWQETKESHFEIFNHREYPQLLLNEAYESKMHISDYQIFDNKDCCFNRNYRNDKNIKRRPPVLTELFGEKLVLWVDRENGILGVADKDFAQLIALDEIERFEIERILPAKGSGGDFFRIFKKEGDKYPTELLRLPCYTFDKDDLLTKVEKVVGQKLKITGGYYDC